MPIRIKCPECDERLSLSDESAGKKVRCKSCDAVFRAPSGDAEEGGRNSRRPEREEDEAPRRRRRDEDEESPRSRRRRDDDEEMEERPRSKAGSKGGRKAAGKKEKKGISVLYIVGVAFALLFLAGALGFLAWRAGIIGSRNADVKEKTVVEDGEPKFTAPDARIGEGRKEITGPDGERAAATQRVKLSMDMRPLADGASEVVVNYEVLVGPELPRANKLVVMETARMFILEIEPVVNEEDRKKGTFTFQLTPATKQKYKKLWISLMPSNEQDVKKHGLRVSNVITLP